MHFSKKSALFLSKIVAMPLQSITWTFYGWLGHKYNLLKHPFCDQKICLCPCSIFIYLWYNFIHTLWITNRAVSKLRVKLSPKWDCFVNRYITSICFTNAGWRSSNLDGHDTRMNMLKLGSAEIPKQRNPRNTLLSQNGRTSFSKMKV